MLDKSDRVVVVHALMRLCRHGFHDAASRLTRELFPRHFTEHDPLEKDIINQNINMASYFFKALVEYSHSIELITKHAATTTSDNDEMNRNKHMTNVLYHSLLADKPLEFNLDLIERFRKLGLPLKLNYFMPLIARQIKQLDSVMMANKTTDPPGKPISGHVEYKRLQSLIRTVKFDFECDLNTDILNQILSWLRFDENNVPKPHVTFTSLVDLFIPNGFNSITLFNCCAYKILNYRSAYIRKNRLKSSSAESSFQMAVGDIRNELNDLSGLIEALNVTSIEIPIQEKLNTIVCYLIESRVDFVDLNDLDNDPVVNTIRLVNQRVSSRSLDQTNRRLRQYIRIKSGMNNTFYIVCMILFIYLFNHKMH